MSGHYKLNPPAYVPGPVQFFGVPDQFGAVSTDEAVQAFNVIRAFGSDADKQTYVSLFFNGSSQTPASPATHQLTDIDEHFTLSPPQEKAVNHGCANTRGEFLTGLLIANGLDDAGMPIDAALRVGACQSTTVSVAKVGSLYGAICAAFQHNLNVGAHA